MASACWRCLSRPSQRIFTAPLLNPAPLPITGRAPFTTAAQLQAKTPPGTPGRKIQTSGSGTGRARHQRIGKQLTVNRRQRPKRTGKAVEPGERRAFRKRIQLSNDNALKVDGLNDLTAEILRDAGSIGQIARLPDGLIDNLRLLEAFKPTQCWGLFRSPHMLVRKETVELVKRMENAIAKKETLRMVITGDRAAGKSIMGLQALSAALLNDYVVVNVPDAMDLTNAHTDYATISHSELFAQPVYAQKLCQATSKASGHILSNYKVELEHKGVPVSRGQTLAQILANARESESAGVIFNAFWKELQLPNRPPVLFVMDGLPHAMCVSDYMSPQFQPIHSHDLAIIRNFVEALGGKSKFHNGAIILGIDNKSNPLSLPSMDLAMRQAVAAQKGETVPAREPYFRKYDDRVFEALKGVDVFNVSGISKPEARSLLEYWAASGLVRQRVDDYAVTDSWATGGGGLVGEMERVSLFPHRI